MAQLTYDRGVFLLPGATVEVRCECEWTGEVTVYDIGDGPEWACPDCQFCYAPSASLLADGSTQAEKNMKELVEKFADKLPEWCQQPAIATIRF